MAKPGSGFARERASSSPGPRARGPPKDRARGESRRDRRPAGRDSRGSADSPERPPLGELPALAAGGIVVLGLLAHADAIAAAGIALLAFR
jgi:hypothetical protein